MDILTTTVQIDPGIEVFYDRLFLETALPLLLHTKFAQRRPLPAKSGKTIKFRRYALLSVATAPLDEGQEPNSEVMSKTDLLATVSQYGKVSKITDVVELTTPDDVIAEATELLGENYGETIDELTRDILAACASSTTCSNGSPTATLLNKTDIDGVVQTLVGNRAKFLTEAILAGTGQGTAPVRPSFWGIADSDLIDDLEDVTGFGHVITYSAQSGVLEGEWGKTGNVRWLVTDKGYVSGNNYSCPIIGRNAYGITEIEGGISKLIFKDRKTIGGPLEQFCTLGWKAMFVARILNDNFMHILICTNG